MRQICKFDKVKDVMQTVPGLSTSIELALETGVVLDTGIDSVANDIDEPSNIWGRISDVFEAMDAQKMFLNRANSTSNNVQTSQPATGETE